MFKEEYENKSLYCCRIIPLSPKCKFFVLVQYIMFRFADVKIAQGCFLDVNIYIIIKHYALIHNTFQLAGCKEMQMQKEKKSYNKRTCDQTAKRRRRYGMRGRLLQWQRQFFCQRKRLKNDTKTVHKRCFLKRHCRFSKRLGVWPMKL